jgi:hypothetical protein
VFVVIKGHGGRAEKLGFRPSRTLLDLIRARRPSAPRRPESPPPWPCCPRRPARVSGLVARFVGKRRRWHPRLLPAMSDDDYPRSERAR